MMDKMPLFIIAGGAILTLFIVYLAFAGPNQAKIQTRRLSAVKDRHASSTGASIDAQLRRVISNRKATKLDGIASQFLPRPEMLRLRISRSGKNWTLAQYGVVSGGIFAITAILLMLKGMPWAFAVLVGVFLALAIPHMVIGYLIKKRLKQFNTRFPDAIDLLVRGLRAGLPVSETMGVVAAELPGPVGEEFSTVTDKMRIGRPMEAALQDTADKLGTPEFQFFVITLAIQRETGGNLAETLANLSDVLRKRAAMKLKIRAMSSEAKASAYIIGILPFAVFGLIYTINPEYMGGFFYEQRLIIAGLGGIVWMSIGAFIMRQMINFEI